MRKLLPVLALLMSALLLAACGASQLQRDRESTMTRWENLVRWNQFDALVDLIHPDWLEQNPISNIDLERLRQFRVSEYRARQILSDPDGKGLERTAQLRMYHIHSAQERVILHREVWRWDKERERWLLHSGLPDPRQH